MNKAVKSALFNALLFPGWGQFYLRSFKRGLLFLLPTLFGMLAIVWMVIQAGITVIKAAPFQKGAFQFRDVFAVALNAFQTLNLFNLLLMVLLISALWVLSIIDAYQLGKKTSPLSTSSGNPESFSGPPG
ncbi:MAG: hypothetical protein KBA28_04695 [Syntrophaceae bacterium]|jgi:hypothetical protein|nr:hypothetical protein [Syntrophaceae bacterium]HQM46469.1 hypothetical protein [Smithellaceae bacterium]